jgi:hypothetical protein
MPFDLMQMPAQPFLKLASANMALWMRFAASPEVTAQATANAGQLLQQAGATTMKLMQSGAFSQLMQGVFKNYTEFLSESGQGALAMLSEGQAALAGAAQSSSDAAADAVQGRGRRARSAD